MISPCIDISPNFPLIHHQFSDDIKMKNIQNYTSLKQGFYEKTLPVRTSSRTFFRILIHLGNKMVIFYRLMQQDYEQYSVIDL